ncbi:hypothetical protein ASG94_04310 [Nocardioides sp. Soil805]|nr:hypothetical protein ASG94_04310 [Nocardioides sp. Soil805]
MTDHDATNTSESIDAPEALCNFLTAYRPTGVKEETWALIADDAVKLVLRAGALTRLRVEKDIQLLGAVVAHLVERGRPVTLDEALSDATLLSFDTSLQVGEKTKENKRGITRRLQAVHRGLPWRAEKRTPEERTDNLVAHTEVDTMHRILGHAHAMADDAEGVAFIAAVSAAREARRGQGAGPGASAHDWAPARRFADRHGWNMTQRLLKACVTHETLNTDQPLAIVIRNNGLSRRDLDLGLTRVRDLPDLPAPSHHDLLRGTA